jgi:hypothetical protein
LSEALIRYGSIPMLIIRVMLLGASFVCRV